jgi:hypothetical protein
VEEVMRGWLAAIRRAKDPFRQINAYAKLRQLFRFFATWDVLDWTAASAAEFAALKKAKTRVGTMDLKIASQAKFIVSEDRHLLNLAEYAGVKILSRDAFRDELHRLGVP